MPMYVPPNTNSFAQRITVFAPNTTVFSQNTTVFARNTTVFSQITTVFAHFFLLTSSIYLSNLPALRQTCNVEHTVSIQCKTNNQAHFNHSCPGLLELPMGGRSALPLRNSKNGGKPFFSKFAMVCITSK